MFIVYSLHPESDSLTFIGGYNSRIEKNICSHIATCKVKHQTLGRPDGIA